MMFCVASAIDTPLVSWLLRKLMCYSVDVRQAGYTYEGEHNDKNQRHGLGHAEFHNGDIYDGHYENGKRHGSGVYKLVA